MASESRHNTTSARESSPSTPSESTAAAMSIRQQPTPSADDERLLDIDHSHEDLCRHDHDHDHDRLRNRYRRDIDVEDQNISIPASSKHIQKMVAPFLAEHIPTQYHPNGHGPREQQPETQEEEEVEQSSTKFCYRHRPDLKCRRQANEPSMEQLQNELASVSQSDQQAISHVWSLFSAAPARHRNMMLQGILTQCCFPQLSFISANVRDLIKIDFLSALPAELGFRILCFLDTTSLCKAAQVSQRWRSLADDDVVWHKMCEQHIDRRCTKCGWGLPLLERKRLRIEKRQIQLRATGRGLNEWSPAITPIQEEAPAGDKTPTGEEAKTGMKRAREDAEFSKEVVKKQCSMGKLNAGETAGESSAEAKINAAGDEYFAPRKRPWKDIYKDRFKVGTAWKYGRCKTRIFKGHTNGVMCVQFDDNVLISGSYDTTAKVWDVNTGEELRTLTGHTSGIRCLQFDDTKLMTGSLDNTLRLWNWRTGQCLRTFQAHQQGIISLHFSGQYVASGSIDKTIRVWNSEDKSTFLLRGHTDWVNSVKVDVASRTLFSASDDLTVRLWDLDTRQCIRVFEGHVGQVQQVLPMPVEFELDDESFAPARKDDDTSSISSAALSDSHDHRHDTPQPKEPFWPDDPSRPAPPQYMVTAALDSTIRLWNVHFQPEKPAAPRCPTAADLDALPTDPLTNSHIPRSQSCLRTYFGHVEGIWSLSADHLRMVSGSEDRMMKIWDPRTGKCERTFTGHAGPVTCSWLSDSRVASGSEDHEVRMLLFGDE